MKKTILICFIALLIANIFTSVCFAQGIAGKFSSACTECNAMQEDYANGNFTEFSFADCVTACMCGDLTNYRNMVIENTRAKADKDGNCPPHLVQQCDDARDVDGRGRVFKVPFIIKPL